MKYSQDEIELLADDFEAERYSKIEKELDKLRLKFVAGYPINCIASLTLDEYVCGLKMTAHDHYDSFCYRIETELLKLGNMKGGTADKFGVYMSQEDGSYRFTKKYGDNLEDAFVSVKNEIERLLLAGQNQDLDKIEESKIANLFKYKLLSTYFPTIYLPIFNEEHLDEFLGKLDIQFNPKEAYTSKQTKLRDFKENDPIMKEWSLHVYMRFLYDRIGIDSQQKRKSDERQNTLDDLYPKNLRSSIQISKTKWLELLDNKSVFREEDLDFIRQLYEEENHASTCKLMGLKKGVPSSTFIPLAVKLAKRILTYIGHEPEKRENGKPRYWNVLFWGRDLEDGTFEWKLRPQLAKALIVKFPDLGIDAVNTRLDDGLTNDVAEITFDSNPHRNISRERPEPVIIQGVQAYPRSRVSAMIALQNSNHKCEIDSSHSTFERRVDSLPYMESHHLIPMAAQGDFEVSIDVPENIVSLCSSCHNEIHYGKNAVKLIEQLYNSRVHLLEQNGIFVSLPQLLKYYGLMTD